MKKKILTIILSTALCFNMAVFSYAESSLDDIINAGNTSTDDVITTGTEEDPFAPNEVWGPTPAPEVSPSPSRVQEGDKSVSDYQKINQQDNSGSNVNTVLERQNYEKAKESTISTLDIPDSEITKTSSDLAKWVINPEDLTNQGTYETSRSLYVGADVTKLEVFYTASGTTPSLTFISPTGNVYSTDTIDLNKDNSDNTNVFKTRKGYRVKNRPDIAYMTIYFSNMSDYGTWNMQASIMPNITEFIVITAKVTNEWETMTTDYKTSPTDIALWYLSADSIYQTNDEIVSIIERDTNIPSQNLLQPKIEIEPSKVSPLYYAIRIGIVVVIIVAAIAILNLFKGQKERVNHVEQTIQARNQRVRERKKQEIAGLKDYFKNQNLDYSDKFDASSRAIIRSKKIEPKLKEYSIEEKLEDEMRQSLPSYVTDDFIKESVTTRIAKEKEESEEPKPTIMEEIIKESIDSRENLPEKIEENSSGNIEKIDPEPEKPRIPSWIADNDKENPVLF